MTFLEAAIEVLRESDGPLHFSEIAKRAVDRRLLSHVGRDPEAAMRSCLTSAVRAGDAVIDRTKPGHYGIRAGATLPEPPAAPEPAPEPAADKPKAKPKRRAASESKAKTRGSKVKDKAKGKDAGTDADKAEPKSKAKKKNKKVKAKKAKDSTSEEAGTETSNEDPVTEVAFEAPKDSGLEGVTDVALVMANAMSRLADERPELRRELEAMQRDSNDAPQDGPTITTKPSRVRRDDSEERGRRRRRRRRRAKRVDWSDGGGARPTLTASDELLDKAAAILSEAGARSLHVRQIAESLAAQDVLGGDISEIERAVTSALLLDVRVHGGASRFVVRGDARYQLRGARVPPAAAEAESGLRGAVAKLRRETTAQLVQWIGTLGARGLEAIARMYLEREGFTLSMTLPPTRGLAALVAEDPEADDDARRTLVLVAPRKAEIDARAVEGDADRHNCGQTLVIAGGDAGEEITNARRVGSEELARWLLREQLAVGRIEISVPVLDASFIESIAGLDT